MKRLFLLLSLIVLGFSTMAQNTSPLKLVNFHKLPNEIVDLTELKNRAGRDSDFDGNKAALIRVKAQGFSEKTMIDFTVSPRPGIEIIDKIYRDGEMWLYVSSNCQRAILIKYMGEFEFALPSKLEAKGVYELILGMETATLVIRAVPAEADIYIDGQKAGTGYASKAVSIGTEHRWKVESEYYWPKEGVEFFNKREEKSINVHLEPNFGYITIKSEPSGAEVYIDNKKVGTTPYMAERVMLGQHKVEIKKYGYYPQAEIVTIKVGDHNKQFENVKLEKDETVAQQPVPVTPTATVQGGNRTFTVNGVSFEMVAVKGGTFTMGCTGEQGGDCWDDESPAHSVTLSDYYIGKFEVTQKLWKAVMGSNPSYFNGDDLPVEKVSWNDCKEFIGRLNQLTGANFRLPTEAEWEYAARGGVKSHGYKYSGSNSIDDVAVYDVNSYNKGSNHPDYGTHAVGTKSPNELGIYDMSGNVLEWCEDWYGDYSGGSQTNPKGPSSGSLRVLRGGSWRNNAWFCRVSSRRSNNPDDRFSSYYGFRLVLVH